MFPWLPSPGQQVRSAPFPWFSLQALLNSREDSSQLMLDTKYLFQVTFPFAPSPHALEMIEIPSSFKLGFLNRL